MALANMVNVKDLLEADGFDREDGTPLVRIIGGDYRSVTHHVRNATGVVDIRSRPMWDEWEADVRIRFDADQFSLTDITNLLSRVGGAPAHRADDAGNVGHVVIDQRGVLELLLFQQFRHQI